jgi:hypothetical protein
MRGLLTGENRATGAGFRTHGRLEWSACPIIPCLRGLLDTRKRNRRPDPLFPPGSGFALWFLNGTGTGSRLRI